MKKILKQILLFIYKVCKNIIYLSITFLIIVFAIFIITFFGFNTFLTWMDKFINKIL